MDGRTDGSGTEISLFPSSSFSFHPRDGAKKGLNFPFFLSLFFLILVLSLNSTLLTPMWLFLVSAPLKIFVTFSRKQSLFIVSPSLSPSASSPRSHFRISL